MTLDLTDQMTQYASKEFVKEHEEWLAKPKADGTFYELTNP